MMPRHGATPAAGPRRRTARWGGVLVAVLALNACGLPVTEDARVVEAEAVPYDLLEPHQAVSGEDEAPTTPRGVPVVFWIRPDGRLTPAAAELACDPETAALVTRRWAEYFGARKVPMGSGRGPLDEA